MHLSHITSGDVNSKLDRFSIVNDIFLLGDFSILSCARPGSTPPQLKVRKRVRLAFLGIVGESTLRFRKQYAAYLFLM